jgi:rhodanese-related sulfurtransferase
MAIENGEKLTIVDLRTPELFAKGHIPGAINLKFEELDKNLDKLSKDTTTVVYCYDIVCHLSARAALELAKKGYKVRELVGGYDSWTERDLKVEGEGQTHKAGSCCGG